MCKCDCGQETHVMPGSLKSGGTVSCGCLKREILKTNAMKPTHGMVGTHEYGCWSSMIRRCYEPKNIAFHNYGGRGIKVCDRWRESIENFIADMGMSPSPAHSIEREDVNGHYEPGNCRWATPRQQGRNKRTSACVTWNGETHCIAEWAEKVGLSKATLGNRLRAGWDVGKALTQPVEYPPWQHGRRDGRV